jgi:ferric iron reductase protein FhuF
VNALSADGLLDDRPALFRAVRAFGRAVGTGETAVAASLFGQAWAVGVTRPAIASLVADRRVPDVSAGNTVLRFDADHRPAGATPVTPRFAALAGDPVAAADPWAGLVADEDALFAWARARMFDAHLARLVDALHDLAPVGRRLLWGNVAAAAAGGFAAISTRPDHSLDLDGLRADAARLLDHPGSPTEGLAELFSVARNGAGRLFVRRQTCCLRYRLPDAPPTCLSCRLLPEAERLRRIRLRIDATVG